LLHFKYINGFLLFPILFFSCTPNYDSGYENTIVTVCKSKISGDFDDYISSLGGNLLYNGYSRYKVKRNFLRQAKRYQRKGISFQEIFIKSKSFQSRKLRIKISFLEKLAYKSGRFWTVSHNWILEYIDGKWRVVKF